MLLFNAENLKESIPYFEAANRLLAKSENKKSDYVRFFDILRSVFPEARCTELMNHADDGISSIAFHYNQNGVIDDMWIGTSENSLITEEEIDILYTRMLTQMSFTTNPVNCPSYAGFLFIVSVGKDMLLIHNTPHYFGLGRVWDNMR